MAASSDGAAVASCDGELLWSGRVDPRRFGAGSWLSLGAFEAASLKLTMVEGGASCEPHSIKFLNNLGLRVRELLDPRVCSLQTMRTAFAGRARLLLRVGNVVRLNCWASTLSAIEPLGADQLRLVAPALPPPVLHHAAAAAEASAVARWGAGAVARASERRSEGAEAVKLGVFTFGFTKASAQLAPRQRLALAFVQHGEHPLQ